MTSRDYSSLLFPGVWFCSVTFMKSVVAHEPQGYLTVVGFTYYERVLMQPLVLDLSPYSQT